MPTTVNVGKSINVEIDFAKMPQTAIDHILYIGARNILMDSHASITAEEFPDADKRQEAASAMVQKKLDALMAGEVRVQSTREGDSVRAEAMHRAMAIVKAILKKNGKRASDYEAKALREAAAKKITPELLAECKAYIEKSRAVETTGDLADLGL